MKYISTGSKELNDKVLEFLQESEKKHPIMDTLYNLFGNILPRKVKEASNAFDEFLKEDESEPLDVVTLHFQDSFITFSRW